MSTCGHPNHGGVDHDCRPFLSDRGVVVSSSWGEALDAAAADSTDAFSNVLFGFFDAVAAARDEEEGL